MKKSKETFSVAYHTLGCKLNFAETSAIAKQLNEHGFRNAKKGEQADLCIVNTCSVTDTADHKCRQAISHLHRIHPNALIIVTGCYAQLKPEELANLEGVELVLGIKEKFDIEQYVGIVQDHQNKKQNHAEIHHTQTKNIRNFAPSCSYDERTRHFLKIQDGCDYYCTYCTIPFARGRSRSASIEETLNSARKAAAEGAKEIVLTGVNLGDFGKGTSENLYQLIRRLDENEIVERYRISSIEPNLLTDEIILFVAESKHFAPHFHIPLQSGCNSVLELMHRRYKRELFAEKVHMIKKWMPNAFIGVDVIVGTRGERPEFFNESTEFIQKLDISQLHVFSYSERAGTKALEIPYRVTPNEKKERSEILHKISDKKLLDFYKANIGKTATVLWEAAKKGKNMNGFTENYIRITAPYDERKINSIEKIKIGNFSSESQLSMTVESI